VFGIGMHSAGLLGQYLARWVGLPNVRRFGVRLTGQVWPGDTLLLAGKVDRVEDDGGERLAHIALTVTRQTGDLVVKGTAVARCR
jgi:acyl dehydratase